MTVFLIIIVLGLAGYLGYKKIQETSILKNPPIPQPPPVPVIPVTQDSAVGVAATLNLIKNPDASLVTIPTPMPASTLAHEENYELTQKIKAAYPDSGLEYQTHADGSVMILLKHASGDVTASTGTSVIDATQKLASKLGVS